MTKPTVHLTLGNRTSVYRSICIRETRALDRDRLSFARRPVALAGLPVVLYIPIVTASCALGETQSRFVGWYTVSCFKLAASSGIVHCKTPHPVLPRDYQRIESFTHRNWCCVLGNRLVQLSLFLNRCFR
ncbi:hypothetical protein PAXRUDRAFT_822694 [Paxillus rubicundulus Ve08.2h10]|uniref:Unplaced genomic scaffold scaffold_35, whole genome shotgun sequence n=1 Tax=Paxillus rubicundulus Ve08.2h10 TaxID=930991 RepID=A0A0D0DLN0_9AGAM|nr:hypothetical protein PAXRUDRAFT_822694 [Paxillus rubicundulus Ve08.2h10]